MSAAPASRGRGRLLVVRLGPLSARIDRRAVTVTCVLAAALAAAFVWAVSLGDVGVPVGDVVAHMTGRGTSRRTALVINSFRLPRVLTGVLVGAAMGASGQVFQRLVRNPLASPDILGVSSGAATAAVFAIVVLSVSTTASAFAALLGAVAAVVAIYLLAYKQGVSSYRLVLVGIGLTAMLDAVIAYLITRAQIHDAQRAAVWITGSLNGRGWEYVVPLALALAVLGPVALTAMRPLRALELGDECALGLGVGLWRGKLGLALIGAALAAVATAAAGPVAFVALVAPQIARRIVGSRSVGLIPAALVGALIVVLSDVIARRLFAPVELPVGIITGVIGAPYLLWLLARANTIGSGG